MDKVRFKIRTNEKLTKKINSDITETVDACELCHNNEGEYYGKAAVRECIGTWRGRLL